MTSREGPTGYIASDGHAAAGAGDRTLVRWLGPRHPRLAAAVLLLASAVATFLVNTGWLGRSIDMLPRGQVAALEFAPLLSGAVVTVGLAVFVLGGSPASRALGCLASLSGLVPLLLPFLVFGVSPQDVGAVVVPWVTAVALHLATFVALLLPAHVWTHGVEKLETTDG